MIKIYRFAHRRPTLVVFDQRVLAAGINDDGRGLVLERVAGELKIVAVGRKSDSLLGC